MYGQGEIRGKWVPMHRFPSISDDVNDVFDKQSFLKNLIDIHSQKPEDHEAIRRETRS
jgi:hypothetical protein